MPPRHIEQETRGGRRRKRQGGRPASPRPGATPYMYPPALRRASSPSPSPPARSSIAMSRGGVGGGDSGGSCTSVSLGKIVRRALRGGGGRKRGRPGPAGERRSAVVDGGVSTSVELISGGGGSASWSEAAVEARRESVVRVVLSGGVVEVYSGVVLAGTVIRRHPPGLCLAHPDVFRNPHGAMVRPLEPLFPGQKFFLLPETTILKLQRKIPECTVGAFPSSSSSSDDDIAPASTDTTTEVPSTSEEEEEEERDAAAAPPDGYCSARDYFVNRELWAEWNFKTMVARGLAAEGGRRRRGSAAGKQKGRRPRGRRNRSDAQPPTAPTARPARTAWEPSLPSVEEEDEQEECPGDDHLRPPADDMADRWTMKLTL